MIKGDVVTQLSPSVSCVSYQMGKGDWSRSNLFISDVHFDGKGCDRALLKRHLEEARAKHARVHIFGDWWDAMQSKGDRRSRKVDLKDEYLASGYFNALLDDTAQFLTPYADLITTWGKGNHETAIENHCDIDLTTEIVRRLNSEVKGCSIQQQGYQGWVFFRARRGSSIKATAKVYWHHGSGGGGPVTRNVTDSARKAVYIPDADMVVRGHVHEAWSLEIKRARVSSSGIEYQDTQHHLQLPTYKDEFHETNDGWWHQTGKSPRPMGGYWVDVSIRQVDHPTRRDKIILTPRRAQ